MNPPMVTVDGPEKAGKSTLLAAIEALAVADGRRILYKHWDRPTPRIKDHWDTLRGQCFGLGPADIHLILWNRSQASEAVYANLLQRDSEVFGNALRMEFGVGRLQQAMGPRVILLGPDVTTLWANRDGTDHPVDPKLEREAFRNYGTQFNFEVLDNQFEEEYTESLAARLYQEALTAPRYSSDYVGVRNPEVLFVSTIGEHHQIPFEDDAWKREALVDTQASELLQYGYVNKFQLPSAVDVSRIRTVVAPIVSPAGRGLKTLTMLEVQRGFYGRLPETAEYIDFKEAQDRLYNTGTALPS